MNQYMVYVVTPGPTKAQALVTLTCALVNL